MFGHWAKEIIFLWDIVLNLMDMSNAWSLLCILILKPCKSSATEVKSICKETAGNNSGRQEEKEPEKMGKIAQG